MQVRRLAAALAGVLALGALAAAPVAMAVEPVPEDILGGPLHADLYPSGLETAPDGTIVVADTGNNEIVRYNPDGTEVWRVGSFGAGVMEFDNPRDIGVDEDNFVYVADTRNSRIVKLTPSGQWVGETTGLEGPSDKTFSFQLGVSARDGKVYVGDTGRHRVVVLDDDLNVLSVFTPNGQCGNYTGLRDAKADSQGNIYIAGYKTNEIFKLSPTGTCLLKWGTTGSAPGQFRTPYGVDTQLDPVTGQELVYVADGINNRVQVFTGTGQFVAQFGTFGEPDQAGTFTTMRRVAVARDGSGDVWTADLWGNRVERWARTSTGYQYAQTIGSVMPQPTSTAIFHEPRGMAFTPSGDLWVTDTVHHSFQKFDSDGDYVETCGERAAEGSALGQFNWPRGLAVDPATGNLWIADTKQHQLQVMSPTCQGVGYVKNPTSTQGKDAQSFDWPYDVAIRPSDRYAFVVDTQNHRVKAYDVANATFPGDYSRPLPTHMFGTKGAGYNQFQWPSGVAVGPDGSVYVADRGNNRVLKLSYSPSTGFTRTGAFTAGGTLNAPEGVAVDADGRVYIADTEDDEVVILTAAGAVDNTITGLSTPSALEISPDGDLYVADTYADVVRSYSLNPGPPPDTTPPTGAFGAPAAGAQVPLGPVTLSGTASDNQGLGTVYVALRRNSNTTWLRPNGTYGTGTQWVPVTLANPGGTSSTWSLTTTLPADGGYYAMLRVDDAAGNQNPTPRPGRSFTAVSGPADSATPTAAIQAPSANAAVSAPVTFTGSAWDDTGVANVKLGIKQGGTNLWWNGTGWQAQATKVTATLSQPGGTTTSWTYTLPAAPPGSYGFSTDVTDLAGKAGTGAGKPAWRTFSVVG
ncbi:MAG: SMP-30/gluconolactonase/LRE family protein [Nocardioides sp.]